MLANTVFASIAVTVLLSSSHSNTVSN